MRPSVRGPAGLFSFTALTGRLFKSYFSWQGLAIPSKGLGSLAYDLVDVTTHAKYVDSGSVAANSGTTSGGGYFSSGFFNLNTNDHYTLVVSASGTTGTGVLLP